MTLKEQALKSKTKYSKQAIMLLSNIKDDDFVLEEFERFCEDKFFIVGGNYVIDFLAFREAQKSKTNKKPLCNPHK